MAHLGTNAGHLLRSGTGHLSRGCLNCYCGPDHEVPYWSDDFRTYRSSDDSYRTTSRVSGVLDASTLTLHITQLGSTFFTRSITTDSIVYDFLIGDGVVPVESTENIIKLSTKAVYIGYNTIGFGPSATQEHYFFAVQRRAQFSTNLLIGSGQRELLVSFRLGLLIVSTNSTSQPVNPAVTWTDNLALDEALGYVEKFYYVANVDLWKHYNVGTCSLECNTPIEFFGSFHDIVPTESRVGYLIASRPMGNGNWRWEIKTSELESNYSNLSIDFVETL